MNIAIMRAFVEIRRILIQETDLRTQLNEIRERLGEHDTQLNAIYRPWKIYWVKSRSEKI